MTNVRYPISEIYPTLQGEGMLSGTPMVIVRTQGCPVGCPFCDTKYTWALDKDLEVPTLPSAGGHLGHWTYMTPEQIVDAITLQALGIRWVLITGGEPAMHHLEWLVTELHAAGFQVALETSGTEVGHLGANLDWICVSPKVGMPGGREIQAPAIVPANELKFVVGKKADVENAEQFLAQYPHSGKCTISLQPMSRSQRATELAVQACMDKGWHLSLQTHYFLNLP